jgi:hypothetical protein
MFELNVDDRLSAWAQHRVSLNQSLDPLQDVWNFWKAAPFVPLNLDMDPYYQGSWPTPWEVIVRNRYDDFTKSMMIAWTLKLTNKFAQNQIEVRTMLDKGQNRVYNIIFIDNKWVINYNDNGPVAREDIPDSFLLENLIEVSPPR